MNNVERERKRFEAWAESCGLEIITMAEGDYYFSDTQSAWEAWQARCPEGWQVVPSELIKNETAPAGLHDPIYASLQDMLPFDGDSLLEYWKKLMALAPQPGEES